MSGWTALRNRYSVSVDPLRTQRKVELALVVLGLLLCLQLLYSGARLLLPGAPQPVAPAIDALQVKPVDRPAAVAPGQSDEIRARPLFWSQRRPLQSDSQARGPASEQQAEGKLKDIKLLGIFGAGDTAGIIALVKDKKQRILLGERLQGWRLDAVEPNRVVLVDGERREELQLLQRKVIAAEQPDTARGLPGPEREDDKRKAGVSGIDSGKPGPKEQTKAPAVERRLSSGGRASTLSAGVGKRPE